jgi:peptidoglycan/LPS O-acetylase OafA/YrhL
MKVTYRADIDGLRALAVVSVILFHTNIPGFSGGFVGVDIFFVISGFLITSIILKEVETDRFSITKFYERRVRRIFPALFPVIAATVVTGAYWLSPRALKELGSSVVATTLFASNILFWHESGYFDAPSLQKPLLHTWSLAVEEQFYLFYPLLLVFIRKFLKGDYFRWLALLLTVSFLVSIYAVTSKPQIAFYWLPPRAWELLVGAMIALDVLPELGNRTLRNLLSLTGTGMMLCSIFLYQESTPFPGMSAALPVLGAGLVIYVGRHGDNVMKKFYEFRPVVLIGLLSYSLYLWHWPVIVFTKYAVMRELATPEKLLIVLSVFAFSYLSWKYIETPFRLKPPILPETSRLFTLSALTMLATIITGSLIMLQEGFPARLGLSSAKNPDFVSEAYTNVGLDRIRQIGKPILIGKKGQAPSFLIWGDSHAESLAPGMSVISEKNGKTGLVLTGPGVPPLVEVGSGKNVNSESDEFNKEVIGYLARHTEIKTVFLAACWSYTNDTPWFKQSISRTIEKLVSMNRNVVIVADVPFLPKDLQQAQSVAWRNSKEITQFDGVSHEDYLKSCKPLLDAIGGYIGNNTVSIIRPGDCLYDRDNRIVLIKDNRLLYDDDNHLSVAGSIYALGTLEQPIMSLLERSEKHISMLN